MTKKGRFVFGFTFGAPLLYLLLIVVGQIVALLLSRTVLGFQREDAFVVVGFAIGVFLVSLLVAQLDPELRTQTLFEPESPEVIRKEPPTDVPK